MKKTADRTIPPSTLFFVTNHFPYGKGETFVDNEVPYLVSAFGKVIVLAREKHKELTRKADTFTHYRHSPQSSFLEKIKLVFYILLRYKLYHQLMAAEKKYMRERDIALTQVRLAQARHDLVKAFNVAMVTEKILRREKTTGELILYSYWLNAGALGITLVRYPKAKTIARGHGGDIHEFRHATQYLSFRNILAQRLNKIVISAPAGRDHFIQFIDEPLRKKVEVSHLGTKFSGVSPSNDNHGEFLVLTCSNIVEVKRLDIIIHALDAINDINIRWVHIGEGALRHKMEQLAAELLDKKTNITYTFLGQKPYEEVMEFYRKNYVDLFINASSSEATPVSIMEANSFGIPAVGFNVGGVGDIVSDKTGRLLKTNDGSPDLAKAIQELLSLSENEMKKLRQSTFENWELYYKADVAYNRFIQILQSI